MGDTPIENIRLALTRPGTKAAERKVGRLGVELLLTAARTVARCRAASENALSPLCLTRMRRKHAHHIPSLYTHKHKRRRPSAASCRSSSRTRGSRASTT